MKLSFLIFFSYAAYVHCSEPWISNLDAGILLFSTSVFAVLFGEDVRSFLKPLTAPPSSCTGDIFVDDQGQQHYFLIANQKMEVNISI